MKQKREEQKSPHHSLSSKFQESKSSIYRRKENDFPSLHIRGFWPFIDKLFHTKKRMFNESFTISSPFSLCERMQEYIHHHRSSSKADDKIQWNIQENLHIKTGRNSGIEQNTFDTASFHNFIWWYVPATSVNAQIWRWKSLHCSIRPSVKMWNRITQFEAIVRRHNVMTPRKMKTKPEYDLDHRTIEFNKDLQSQLAFEPGNSCVIFFRIHMLWAFFGSETWCDMRNSKNCYAFVLNESKNEFPIVFIVLVLILVVYSNQPFNLN